MTEPTRPPGSAPENDSPPRTDSAPSPFDAPEDRRFDRPAAGSSDGERSRPGVTKPLLIGCAGCGGLVLLLGVIGLVWFGANASSAMAWMFGFLEEQLEPMLPEDLPDDLRSRYDAAWDGALEALRAGEFSTPAVQAAQQEILSVARGAEEGEDGRPRLSVQQVERLAAALEQIPASSSYGAPPGGGGEEQEGSAVGSGST